MDVPTVVAVPTVILPKAGCETTKFVNQEVLVVDVCRWWFQMCFFVVHPLPGEMIQFDQYVSNRLVQPPPSCSLMSFFGKGFAGRFSRSLPFLWGP